MTYLASAAGALWNQVQLWTGRANQAWGTSRVWNSGSSFETDLAAMTTDRNNWQASSNTWQTRANTSYDSGVWGSGNLWSADAHNDPAVWTNRYNTGYSAGYAQGQTDLKNAQPDTVVVSSGSLDARTAGEICRVTLPKAGHWFISARFQIGGSWHSQGGDPFMNMDVNFTDFQSGVSTLHVSGTSTSGVQGFSTGAGFSTHGDYGGGAVLTASISNQWRIDGGTASAWICAHWVPTTTYPT